MGHVLPPAFYDRNVVEVAIELLGKLLVSRTREGLAAGRIVEVEAYLGDGTDPGSHSQRGPTARNASMFAAPGRIYAYRIYGIHVCINLVCEAKGIGAAVLLRAVEPVAGIATMRRGRKLREDQSDLWIARGPGRLAQALALGLESDGQSALRGAVTLRRSAAWATSAPGASAPRSGPALTAERVGP